MPPELGGGRWLGAGTILIARNIPEEVRRVGVVCVLLTIRPRSATGGD